LEQLLALYTDPESHNAQRHRQMDRQTDGQQDDANSRSYCVAVRSAKNLFLPAKTIFASPVFTMEKTIFSTVWQKPANPGTDRWTDDSMLTTASHIV